MAQKRPRTTIGKTRCWSFRPQRAIAPRANRSVSRSAVKGMSERDIVFVEALDDSEQSRQIRSKLSADGAWFQVFLVGKDGDTAVSANKPLSADYLFGEMDAMPMRREEMRRSR